MRKTKLLFLITMAIVLIIALCACNTVKGEKGDNGRGIVSIEKTSTDGYIDTYTITYTDGTTSTFTVTNADVSKCTHNYINYICSICGKEFFTPGLSFVYNSELDGSYYVSHYEGLDKNVYIPSTYNDGKVTRIGDDVFKDKVGLNSVFISDNIVSIGNNAFESCESLVNVIISANNSLNSIGDNTFKDCKNLNSFNIGNVTKIGKSAFENCISLGAVEFSNNVNEIGEKAFYNCEKIICMSIPESLEYIGKGAFSNCTNLTILDWNAANCQLLGLSATIWYNFFGNSNLTTVNISSEVKSMPVYLFTDCKELAVIRYYSTKENWSNVENNSNWNNTGAYKIYCTDGTIDK